MTFSDLIEQAQERLSAPRLYVDAETDADIRIIAELLDLFDHSSGPAEEDMAFLDGLRARRARASLSAGSREAGRTAAAEVTTHDDIDRINTMLRQRGAFTLHLADTHAEVWSDFRAGHRCSVCGMTPAQAAAAGYDCAREC